MEGTIFWLLVVAFGFLLTKQSASFMAETDTNIVQSQWKGIFNAFYSS